MTSGSELRCNERALSFIFHEIQGNPQFWENGVAQNEVCISSAMKILSTVGITNFKEQVRGSLSTQRRQWEALRLDLVEQPSSLHLQSYSHPLPLRPQRHLSLLRLTPLPPPCIDHIGTQTSTPWLAHTSFGAYILPWTHHPFG